MQLFFFFLQDKTLLYPNLSVYVCVKLPPRDLNLSPYPPHPTSTYTYKVTIAPRCAVVTEYN